MLSVTFFAEAQHNEVGEGKREPSDVLYIICGCWGATIDLWEQRMSVLIFSHLLWLKPVLVHL